MARRRRRRCLPRPRSSRPACLQWRGKERWSQPLHYSGVKPNRHLICGGSVSLHLLATVIPSPPLDVLRCQNPPWVTPTCSSRRIAGSRQAQLVCQRHAGVQAHGPVQPQGSVVLGGREPVPRRRLEVACSQRMMEGHLQPRHDGGPLGGVDIRGCWHLCIRGGVLATSIRGCGPGIRGCSPANRYSRQPAPFLSEGWSCLSLSARPDARSNIVRRWRLCRRDTWRTCAPAGMPGAAWGSCWPALAV